MRSLFGEGLHPDANQIRAQLIQDGTSETEARQAVRLGRRFPQYGSGSELKAAARKSYERTEVDLGRPLTPDEKLSARQHGAAVEFKKRMGREPIDPAELAGLGTDRPTREAVAGYDFVFTPVKSVATLWGVGSAQTRDQVFEAHCAAVSDALTWLESNVALTRSGNQGEAQLNSLGVTAACFHHWDSRAGDPDLHTHVAISNKVQGPDEKWRSLDGRPLFAAAVSLSERYNTRIEDELRSRLGVEFQERANSTDDRRAVREITGVPQPLLERFSKRRQGIEQVYQDLLTDYRETHGRDPAVSARHQLYQQATLTDRPEKQRGRSLGQMVSSWQQEASGILGTANVEDAIERATRGRATSTVPIDKATIADQTLNALMATRATWNIHHVRAEAHRQTRQFRVDDRDALIAEIVGHAIDGSRSIRIEAPRAISEPPQLRRLDGESVFVEHGSTLFTSARILDAEHRITAAANLRTLHRVAKAFIENALSAATNSGLTLNREQAAMVRAFCQSGRVVQLGLAPAGAGKTTAMKTVAEAWQASGRSIIALAPSAVAADILGQELHVEADTLSKFDHDRAPIAAGTMILVDEAGMAGTLMLARVVDRALASGAVVRLLGDDQQLSAIEAGGVLRQLDHEVGAVRLNQVVRFADPAEAAATLQVRDGDPQAVNFYLDRDRVLAGTDQTIPEVAYSAWLSDARAGVDSLLIAASTQTVAELNARARADLVLSDRVGVDGVPLRDGNAAGIGDRVCTRRNARKLAVNRGRDWVKNGDGWRVLAVHKDGALTVEHRRHHGRVTLPGAYVSEHVELDYARTIRRTQGMTVDRAHLIVDPQLNREDLYVGLSRARLGTQLYVATMTDPGPDHLPDSAGSTRNVLTGIIARSGVEPSASEAIREAAATLGNLRRMGMEYEYALGVHVGSRYRQAAEEVHPGISADPAWPSVAHRLYLAEGAGHSPAEVLQRADAMRDYAGAHSDTQVLAFRLDRILASMNGQSEVISFVPGWLAPPPPRSAEPPWDAYLPARYAELATRIAELANEAALTPPPWFDEVGHGAMRNLAIRHVVAYRAVYAVRSHDPTGPEPPAHCRQHDAWTATNRVIAETQVDSPTGPPGSARLCAALDQDQRSASYDAPHTTRGSNRHI